MGYLIMQMLASLAVAFVVGFASAWLIQRSFAERKVQQLRDWVSEAEQVCERWEAALKRARGVLAEFDREFRDRGSRAAESPRGGPSTERVLQGKIVNLERVTKQTRPDASGIVGWQRRHEGLGAKYTDAEQRVAALKSRLAGLRQKYWPAGPVRAVERPEVPTEMQEPAHGEPADDLQRVSGIGPVFERTLNEMGIYRFEQLAQLTEHDLERVAARLETFPYRIIRDRWLEQARELAGRI